MKTLESGSLKDLRTSIRWLTEDPEFEGISIVDPTGWDDYDHFYKKKIKKDEFRLRLAQSLFKEDEKES
jgi:hypothetical protein